MAEDADAQIIREFARDISARLDEAAIIARTAKGFGKEGCTRALIAGCGKASNDWDGPWPKGGFGLAASLQVALRLECQ